MTAQLSDIAVKTEGGFVRLVSTHTQLEFEPLQAVQIAQMMIKHAVILLEMAARGKSNG